MSSFPLFCSATSSLLAPFSPTTKAGAFKIFGANPCTCRAANLSSSSLYLGSLDWPSFANSEYSHMRHKSVLHRRTFPAIFRSSTGGGKDSSSSFQHRSRWRRRRWFSLRLRPRLRLLSDRLKLFRARDLAEDARLVLRNAMKKVTPITLVPVAIGLLFLLAKFASRNTSKEIPYSDLVLNLQRGLVSAAVFEEDSRRIYFNKIVDGEDGWSTLHRAGMPADCSAEDENGAAPSPDIAERRRSTEKQKTSSTPKWEYYVRRIDSDGPFLLGLMRERGITYSSAPQSGYKVLTSVLTTLVTLWISLVPMMWFLQRQIYGKTGAGKKRHATKQTVCFNDVEGVDAAKAELMEIVSCLQGSLNYKQLGAKLPRGVLLSGPPGTGKTLLARAVAGEAGIPFFAVSASEFVELFAGRGAARVRQLFNEARECAPSIVFIDELDAVGSKRGRGFNDERDQTLNQLLTEMDGFESDMKVIVMGATNRPEALDQALCRPGRFSRKVTVGVPDLDGRKKIVAVHLRGVPLEESCETVCNLVASLTEGFVGADLSNIVNEAALLAARRGGSAVSGKDIREAIKREKLGIHSGKGEMSTDEDAAEERKSIVSKLFPWLVPSQGAAAALRSIKGYGTLSWNDAA